MEKREKPHELNIFHDKLRLNSDAAVIQQNLDTIIVIGQAEITSLEVIPELNNLKELWIVECCLRDVKALKKCVSLEKLYLYSNEIRDIRDLSNMRQLKIISLARNAISDLGGLRELTGLRDLNVAGNEVRKIENIFPPKSELAHINLSGNPLYDFQDIDNLWTLKNLKSIEFGDPVYGESPLIASNFNYRQYLIRRLPSLREIDFHPIGLRERVDSRNDELSIDKKIFHQYMPDGSVDSSIFTKILSSSEFLHIKHLKMAECSLKEADLRDIFLPELETLDLSKNLIESLRELRSLKNLHTLWVSHNQLGRRRDYEKTTKFSNLVVLHADHNEIRSIVDMRISKMSSLKYIFLQNNEITDINGIQDFPCLNTAVLDNNKIEIIAEDGFHCNVGLTKLFLENNKLTYLKFAQKLPNVEKLFIAKNNIKVPSELVHLRFLGNLRELTILGNPLCKKCNHYREIREIVEGIIMIDGHRIV